MTEDRTERRFEARKKKRNRRLKVDKLRLVLSLIVIFVVAMTAVSVRNVAVLHSEQKQLKQKNAELKKEKAELQEEFESVTDKNYIEEQARKQLNMIKPGEVLLIMKDDQDDSKKKSD